LYQNEKKREKKVKRKISFRAVWRWNKTSSGACRRNKSNGALVWLMSRAVSKKRKLPRAVRADSDGESEKKKKTIIARLFFRKRRNLFWIAGF
jgi:hypothetical protein